MCECSHALSVSHAQVTFAVSRMTQERVLALYRGYVCQLSRMTSIPFAAMPPSSLTLSADSCMLQQLSGPLSLFQRIVLVAPEAHTKNEPIPYSNSLTAALSISVPDLKAEITQMVLSVAKRIGADCAQISGNSVPCACLLTVIFIAFAQLPSLPRKAQSPVPYSRYCSRPPSANCLMRLKQNQVSAACAWKMKKR